MKRAPLFSARTLTPARYLRTFSSSTEAFPRHTDYACSLTRFRRRLSTDERVALVALACVVAWAFMLMV